MIKTYTFNYDGHLAEASFKVDTEKFTIEHAKATLEFFTWDYDIEEDPINEVMKKYALEAIREASFYSYNLDGIKQDFNQKEGFCKIDGTSGIEITSIEHFEFDGDNLEMTIQE